MIQEPPIISPIEFAGMKNKLILVECDQKNNPIELIHNSIKDSVCMYYTNEHQDTIPTKQSYIINFNKIAHISKIIRHVEGDADFHIVHRIDLMNLDLTKKARGSQIKAYLSMLSPTILRGSNIIVTSCCDEYTIRDISDYYINLRTK